MGDVISIRESALLPPSPREAPPADPRAAEGVPRELAASMEAMRSEVADLRAMILAQNALLERLVAAQGTTRLSGAQERAIRRAIHDRSALLAAREGLPRRAIAEAIRRTLRELTGARSPAEIPAGKAERALAAASSWDMPGALRRIRREMGQ